MGQLVCMNKSNYELLCELKTVLKNSKKEVTMTYFDEEDKILLARIDESDRLAESLAMSPEKMMQPFTI